MKKIVVEARWSSANSGKGQDWRQEKWCCVLWDWKGIVHYELLPPGQTIDSNLYCQQLERLCQAIERKRSELINRKGVVFMTTPDPTHFWRLVKNWENLIGKFWCIHLYRLCTIRLPFVSISTEFS